MAMAALAIPDPMPRQARRVLRGSRPQGDRMPREITDGDGVTWTCIQAFAGLGKDPAKEEAARIGDSSRVRVVCTPSGGARSVTLELPQGWEEGSPDDELLAAIARQRRDG
jgi:hypothetical protein